MHYQEVKLSASKQNNSIKYLPIAKPSTFVSCALYIKYFNSSLFNYFCFNFSVISLRRFDIDNYYCFFVPHLKKGVCIALINLIYFHSSSVNSGTSNAKPICTSNVSIKLLIFSTL